MDRIPLNPDAQLEASLRRIRAALQSNRNQYAAIIAQIMADTGAEVTERVAARLAERHRRRLDRWRRRDERRAEHIRRAAEDLPRGIVYGAAAIVCVVLAILRPEMWWLVFVALGLGTSAASMLKRAPRPAQTERETEDSENRRAAEASGGKAQEREPAPPAPPPDPKVIRIQALCDKLLAELETGPPIVREVMTKPQETIGGLRQACLEIARRERELREVLAAQDEASLVAERDALVTRLSNEHDEVVRDRLGQALDALGQQLAHRAELTTAAARLEAENTRILYTLESLHMQLLRARSTDVGAPELGGKLRESLGALGTEIDAVAEALEIATTSGGAGRGAVPPATAEGNRKVADADRAERERAERYSAARRASQARDSERH